MFFKNYRTVIVVGAMVLAAVILLSYSLKYDSGMQGLKAVVLECAAPLQKAFSASLGGVEGAWRRYIYLVELGDENRNLKNKMADLQARLILYQEGYLEAQRLKKILTLKESMPYNFTTARVIGKEQASLAKTLWIDKGSAHGLKSGMPVLVPPGLIGRLTDVAWHNSKVLLLIDENSNVDVMVQRTRTQGIARGAGSRGCEVKYVSKIQDIKESDIVVTSGLSNVFPKGLLVGRVSSVDRMGASLFLKIRLAPFADFSALEEVMVLTSDLQENSSPRKAVK